MNLNCSIKLVCCISFMMSMELVLFTLDPHEDKNTLYKIACHITTKKFVYVCVNYTLQSFNHAVCISLFTCGRPQIRIATLFPQN